MQLSNQNITKSNRLELLDYGRLIAAFSVLFYHYFFNGINNGKICTIDYIPILHDVAKYGYLGVNFFFMISGYVIFLSARDRSASEFVVNRAIRIFPAFWIAVIFTGFFTIVLKHSIIHVSIIQVIVNMTMLPDLFGFKYVDGVYWTLQLELKFYLMVSFLLLLGLKKK